VSILDSEIGWVSTNPISQLGMFKTSFLVLGFELRVSDLLGSCSNTSSFCLVIFQIGPHVSAQDWPGTTIILSLLPT
jgi:hypothetical protein